MRYLKAIAVVGLAMSAFAQPAAATVIGGSCTSVALSPTELSSATMTCGNFNSNLGTLTSISLTINGHIEGTITMANSGTTTAAGIGTTSSAFSVNPLAGFAISNPLLSLSFNTGLQSITAGGSYLSPSLSNDGSSGPLINTSNLAPYQDVGGIGSFSIVLGTLSGFGVSGGGGNFTGGQSTEASASATLSYTYNNEPPPVPEPASMALLGTGLLGLGMMIRRRRRS
jgi:hypothetical protein